MRPCAIFILLSCQIPREGTYRCRILYDANTLEIEFKPYTFKEINTLQLMEAPEGYDYAFKYADRSVIDTLYARRGAADDILITRDGYITDTSIANIAFRKDARWYTPSRPLLAGTTWKRLVSEGILIPRPIHQDDLQRYDGFYVFNAMKEWGETIIVRAISNIQ
jgi:4-amino-4-deoxychorismate lyase